MSLGSVPHAAPAPGLSAGSDGAGSRALASMRATPSLSRTSFEACSAERLLASALSSGRETQNSWGGARLSDASARRPFFVPARRAASPARPQPINARPPTPASPTPGGDVYQSRALRMLAHLSGTAFVTQTPAGADICAFLQLRRKALGQTCLIAVLPWLFVGHDGFYVSGPSLASDAPAYGGDIAQCALSLGCIESVDATLVRITDKLGEIWDYLLQEGGTERLMSADDIDCMRVPVAQVWQRPWPQRLVGASHRALVGLMTACVVGRAASHWATGLGALAVMHLELCVAQALSAQWRETQARARDAAWRKLCGRDAWELAEAFCEPAPASDSGRSSASSKVFYNS